jgi:protein required for attachment to host cells
MALPHRALVLVADGTKTLFLRNHGDQNQIDLRTESHDKREDRKDREIKTDAPGTQGQRWGDARPAMDETDFHQQEEDRWAHAAAEAVNERVLNNEIKKLDPAGKRELAEQLLAQAEKDAANQPATA